MMEGGHHHNYIHRLLVAHDSPVHRLAPQIKLLSLMIFVSAVAATPGHAVWVFALDAALLAVVAAAARVPVAVFGRRVLVIAPFLVVAMIVPLIGDGPHTSIGLFELSTAGLWAGWNIAAKALLGATASILLTATTSIPELLTGMARLRVPRPVVAIVVLLVRYLDLIADQLHRMHVAMTARGHDPRWLWQARPIASAAGCLFIRSYERGERIHHAMVARGFMGHMPDPEPQPGRPAVWIVALTPPVIAVTATITALLR